MRLGPTARESIATYRCLRWREPVGNRPIEEEEEESRLDEVGARL